jgi:serine/threonine protein kinase
MSASVKAGGVDLKNVSSLLLASRYKFINVIGGGQFSQIIEAEDTASPTKQHFAIKIMDAECTGIGIQEARRLRDLNQADAESFCPVVRLFSTFYFQSHFCLVLELLGQSLHEHVLSQGLEQKNIAQPNQQATQGLPLADIREVALQLVAALGLVSNQRMIHADIKPDNVLLVDGKQFTRKMMGMLRKKVCLADLGNAIAAEEIGMYYDDFEVQSLPYRAPEVLLGLPFGSPIDMW